MHGMNNTWIASIHACACVVSGCRSRLIHGFAMRPYASVAPTQSAAKYASMHIRAIYVDVYDMCATSMHESLRTIHGIILAVD